MERVESSGNRSVRRAVELSTPGGVDKHGAFLVEGPRFVADMVRRSPGLILELLVCEGAPAASGLPGGGGIRALLLPEKVFGLVSDTVHSQGVAAVCRLPVQPERLEPGGGPSSVLVMDGISDPGNAGTLLRCAAAFGFSAVLALEGTCNPYSPKVSRAAAGANAFLPVMRGLDAPKASAILEVAGYTALAAEKGGRPVYSASIPSRCALVVGSEAHGISEAARTMCRGSLAVPQSRDVESLNAAVAGAVLMSWIASSRATGRA